jgi:hypothetical protein
MNTSYPRGLMALAEITDRQARQLRTLSQIQLAQGVTLLALGLVQIIHTFMITRGAS